MRAVVTGGAGGIGRALVHRLTHLGYLVESLDIADGRDATDPAQLDESFAGARVVCLNAGVLTGTFDIAALTDAQYEHVRRVNFDAVVYGVRAALRAQVESIIVTASLAGLTAFPADPIYTATKHAVVGLVRALAHTARINAICPGIVDTPLAGRAAEYGLELIHPDKVADALEAILRAGRSGECWTVQPGRPPEVYEFRGVPGPRP